MAINWSSVKRSLAKHVKATEALRAKFNKPGQLREKMGKLAKARAVRWEWYSEGFYDLDPTFFILSWGIKPGRPLKDKPSRYNGAVRYGFDEEGRIVIAQTFWKAKPGEEFWQHENGSITTAGFDENNKIYNTKLLLLENGYPSVLLFVGQAGTTVRRFEYRNHQIVRVTQAHAKYMLGPIEKLSRWSYWVHELTHKASGEVRGVTFYEEGGKDVWSYKPPKYRKTVQPPTLDLRKDMPAVATLLERAVSRFAAAQEKRFKSGRVSGIGLGYMYYTNGDPPYVSVHIDTRPEYEPDGVWTHEFWETLKCPQWQTFLDAHEASDFCGTVIDHSGKKHELKKKQGDPMALLIGEMLVEALKQARAKKVFVKLQRSENCEMGVEDIDGAFGWPVYEKRGAENRV